MATAVRPFVALNGQELKRAVLAQIERQMDMDFHFRLNSTYARVSWSWRLAVDSYPTETGTFSTGTDGNLGPLRSESEGDLSADQVQKALESEPDRSDLAGKEIVAAPLEGKSADEARREAGLAVPSPRQVATHEGRVTVDAPVVPREKPGEPPSEARLTVENEHPGKRSVSARTRANPKGVEPPASQR